MKHHLLLALTVSLTISASGSAPDWPQWRGPKRDGVSTEKGLLKSWPADGPALLWKAEGLGEGFSTVSISAGKLFTMGDIEGASCVLAMELAGGKIIWKTPIGGASKPGGYAGPRCTPTVDGELLYAVNQAGDFVCLSTKDGAVRWKKNYREDFNRAGAPIWGFSESPLVDGDWIILVPGSDKSTVVALDKKTGALVWESAIPYQGKGHRSAGYNGVVVSQGAGVKQYVALLGHGLVGVRASDGKFLWGYSKIANGTATISTPVVSGDLVFGSSAYNAGGAAALKLSRDGDGVKAEEVYRLEPSQVQNHHGGMILIGKHIYLGHGHGQGIPTCVELETGNVVWQKSAWQPGERAPGSGSAAVVAADGHLYFRYQSGNMALIEASPTEFKLKGTFKLASVRGPSWPHPVIHDGKLYIRDQDNLLCYDVRQK